MYDLARVVLAVCPTTQTSQELHFSPLQADAQFIQKAYRDPTQGNQGADASEIEELDLFPAKDTIGELQTVFRRLSTAEILTRRAFSRSHSTRWTTGTIPRFSFL